MKKIREKIISLICIVTVFVTTCFGGMIVSANDSSDITLQNAPEKDFTQWTFESVNIDDQTLTSDLNWEKPAANAAGLDKTIFNGKILFPAGTGNDFGNFYIGGSAGESASKYSGFLIRGAASNAISLAFQDASGTIRNIANLWEANTGTTLRGNENLQFSLSVEYLSEADGVVSAKVGVFFNGKLYNNTYYTVDNLPKECLTQHIKWKAPANSPKVASHQFGDITLDNAPEKDFTQWTFRDVNIDDQTLTSDLNWEKPAADAAGLDKTIFNGKVLFPAGTGNDFGNFYIGGSAGESASKYSGFLIRGAASNAISLAFQDASGTIRNIANLWEANTGTTLRGNENLQFSLSVEYLSEADGVVSAKVGVFFNGKLYNNTYYTVEDLPKDCLTQHIKWKSPANSPVIASYPEVTPEPSEDITLETAPEKDFATWTFSSVGIDDQTVTTDLNWGSDWESNTIGNSLDKTLFQGKINFANGEGDAADFYIGGADATDDGTATTSKYGGLIFQTVGTTGLKLGYRVSGTNTIHAIAEFDSTTAEVELRGNAELWLAFSVEYLSVENEEATLKLGVFFNGKLYDNTYYTIENIPTKYLNQNIRLKAVQKNNAVASYPVVTPEPEPTEDIYLETAPEKDFAAWTFSSVGIDDQTVTTDLNWGSDWESNTIGNSLDKTLFQGKINFANGEGDAADFYIGGADATDDGTATTSKYGGLVFQTVGTTGLKLGYRVSGTNKIHAIAEFDSTTAGAELRGNEELWLAFSVEYLNVENEEATLKLGVFFNGKLYDGTYYTIENIPTKYLNQNIRLKAVQKNNAVASYPEALPEPEKEFEGINETYEELTLRNFSILNQQVDSIEEGKDFRVENYHDKETLDGTAVSVMCNFPESGSARFSVGGSFWRGVYVGSCADGKLEVCYVNAEGKTNRLTYLDAETAGVQALTGTDVTIRLTFDVQETSDTTSDFRLGIYINGTLYDGKHYTVRNADTETLTRTFKLYASSTPFKIQSIKKQPDLSIYGFDNETWKNKI